MDLVNGKVSYADNSFLELLKLWKKIWDENLIVESRNMKESKENILFTDETVTLNEGENHLVYVPCIPGKPVFPAQFNLFCINKYSKNKDIAAEFLSLFISKEYRLHILKQEQLCMKICHHITKPTRDFYYHYQMMKIILYIKIF